MHVCVYVHTLIYYFICESCLSEKNITFYSSIICQERGGILKKHRHTHGPQIMFGGRG